MKAQRFGSKIRTFRVREGMSQAALAEKLGISASYLNLIEHDRRPLTAGLLLSLAQVFQIDLQSFSGEHENKMRSELMEVFADPLFEQFPLTTTDIQELCVAAPAASAAVTHLYRAWLDARMTSETLALRMSEDLATSSLDRFSLPSEEVSDFLQRKMNYFEDLEVAAEQLWRRGNLDADDLPHGLSRLLRDELGVRIEYVRAASERGFTRTYDSTAGLLRISESLPQGSRNFQLAHMLGLLTQSSLLDQLTVDESLTTEASRALCRVALANYFAGAVLMPYQPFLQAAQTERYDIELLAIRFGVNFEQVCHRLTTLRRRGQEGVPFHFLRVDIAGNISKRFSASGIQLSRFGACPRWNIHQAFLTPERIITQLARMPDGTCYFSLARTVTRDIRGFHVPRMVHAINLGCRVEDAPKLIYAEGMNLQNLEAAVPIGSTCRLCERLDCEQRAFPPLQHKWSVNENHRGISFYAPAL